MPRFDAPSPRQRPILDRLRPPNPVPPLMNAGSVPQCHTPCAADFVLPPFPFLVRQPSSGQEWSLNRPWNFAQPGLREGRGVHMAMYELCDWCERTPMDCAGTILSESLQMF